MKGVWQQSVTKWKQPRKWIRLRFD